MQLNTPTWDEAVQSYQRLGRAQGLAERTLGERAYNLDYFYRKTAPDLADENGLRAKAIDFFAVRRGLSPSTFNTRRRILRAFTRWLLEERIIETDVLRGIKKRRENDVPRAVDGCVLKRLLRLPDTRTFHGLRDLALLLLMLDCGIRPKEAFALLPGDIEMDAKLVTIRATVAKTGRSRTLPVSLLTAQAISNLIRARRETWGQTVPVFCTNRGGSMSRFLWAARLSKYSARLGTKVRPYDLRHTFAVNLLRNGGNALALQKLLGHTTLAMTKRYVSLTEADLQAVHAVASPVMRLFGDQRK
jgi:site-specific recombinase XerD